ncbi:hypothetical protein EB73_06610 [Mycobacterium sp. SWH-M3]|nr:hypothetical protein EB73_06610 [Mycobacterium sp. SWH-M3]
MASTSSDDSSNLGKSGTIRVRTKFPSAIVVASSWPGSGQHEPDDLVSTIHRAVETFGDDADLEIIIRRREPSLDGTAKTDRLRRLCETPFDILEIEDEDGIVTDTPVVRATDVIATLDGHY